MFGLSSINRFEHRPNVVGNHRLELGDFGCRDDDIISVPASLNEAAHVQEQGGKPLRDLAKRMVRLLVRCEQLRRDAEAGFIGRGLIDMRYALSENTEIVNKLLVESGEYNTFAQNDLGVSVTMNSHLALKAGWQARHNSDVAPDIKKTDTLTTMNVVYRFK